MHTKISNFIVASCKVVMCAGLLSGDSGCAGHRKPGGPARDLLAMFRIRYYYTVQQCLPTFSEVFVAEVFFPYGFF